MKYSKRIQPIVYLVFLLSFAVATFAEEATPHSKFSRLPVKEVTVFKDGHAFVLHEGLMDTDKDGNVQMDYLPTPVIGTFWSYSANKDIRQSAVTVGTRKVKVERTSLTIHELLDANPGAEISFTYSEGAGVKEVSKAVIVGILNRSSEELEAVSPPNSGDKLTERSNLLQVVRDKTTSIIPIERIQTLSFSGDYKKTVSHEEFRNLMTMKLDWGNRDHAKQTNVGLLYLQRGIRWIPSYRITLDGKDEAKVELQATLINEMTDLTNVTTHLVIGVPSFVFKETIDPISLQQTAAQLSSYFQEGQTGFGFSNAIMTQSSRMGERFNRANPQNPPPAGVNLGPEVAGTEKAEDLFVFTIKNISLKKGQRMVIPITEFKLKYQDIYKLDLQPTPPSNIRINANEGQMNELLKLMNSPKATHTIRLKNTSKYPLTTAPTIILSNGKLISQAMMTYTSSGGETDINLTTATDIRIKKSEVEVKRTPNAIRHDNTLYERIDLKGTLTLTNFGKEPVTIEINRTLIGNVDKANLNGTFKQLNLADDNETDVLAYRPDWWSWYGWPIWWGHLNRVGRITWRQTLPPGKASEFTYEWHYFWR